MRYLFTIEFIDENFVRFIYVNSQKICPLKTSERSLVYFKYAFDKSLQFRSN